MAGESEREKSSSNVHIAIGGDVGGSVIVAKGDVTEQSKTASERLTPSRAAIVAAIIGSIATIIAAIIGLLGPLTPPPTPTPNTTPTNIFPLPTMTPSPTSTPTLLVDAVPSPTDVPITLTNTPEMVSPTYLPPTPSTNPTTAQGGGDCSTPCVGDDDCRERLACYNNTCWDDCICERANCPVDRTPGCGECSEPCWTTDDCNEGLICSQGFCWDDCICDGDCSVP